MADVVAIAKKIQPKSMAKDFPGTVREILGTCVSVGCKVDGDDPRNIIAKVKSGEIVPK
jgi:large subunit ribosomal protein L12e